MKIPSHLSGCRNILALFTLALVLTACSTHKTVESQSAAALPPQTLLTGEILNILHVINNGEIKQGGLALQRSSDPYVLYMAQLLVQDHMALNQRVAALAVANGVKMEESVLSRTLHTQTNDILESEAKLSGKQFDCTFLKDQVDVHAMVGQLIREQLLPSATTPEVKELLIAAAPRFEYHRKQALDYYIGLQSPPL